MKKALFFSLLACIAFVAIYSTDGTSGTIGNTMDFDQKSTSLTAETEKMNYTEFSPVTASPICNITPVYTSASESTQDHQPSFDGPVCSEYVLTDKLNNGQAYSLKLFCDNCVNDSDGQPTLAMTSGLLSSYEETKRTAKTSPTGTEMIVPTEIVSSSDDNNKVNVYHKYATVKTRTNAYEMATNRCTSKTTASSSDTAPFYDVRTSHSTPALQRC